MPCPAVCLVVRARESNASLSGWEVSGGGHQSREPEFACDSSAPSLRALAAFEPCDLIWERVWLWFRMAFGLSLDSDAGKMLTAIAFSLSLSISISLSQKQ